MRACCRAVDWSATPLGPVERWPASLTNAVRLCLDAHFPMSVWAGEEAVLIYNDGYPPVLGKERHPWALGRRACEVWSGLWDRLRPEIESVLAGTPTLHEDARFVIPRDGRQEETFFTYSFTPIREPDGRVTGALNVFVETTQRVRSLLAEREALLSANERLREADERKSRFLATLSHELRNPLAPIRNSLEVLARIEPGGDASLHAREVIGRQVDQLAHLVDDLLDATRIARASVQLRREPLELNDLVQRTVDDHRLLFENAGVHLAFTAAPAPLPVHADASRVAQIVGNFLHNASKFTPAGGRVAVASRRDGGAAVVTVTDDGDGIAPEVITRLFQPFVQADRSLDRSKGGLGLGLALAKDLAELHGGGVEARSAGPGAGAEFLLRLPLDAASASRTPRARPADSPRARRRVLVIEDNLDAAQSLRALLELLGHQAWVAYDGPEGIARAAELRPDVVLCDIGLPGLSGYDVARALRADAATRGALIAAVTGYALPEDVERAAAAGFDHHIPKPISLDRLTRVLQESAGSNA